MSSQTRGPLRAPVAAPSAARPRRRLQRRPTMVACGCRRTAWSCRLGDGAAGEVVDDDRAVEPGDRRLGAVELLHPRAPFAVVDPLGRLPRLPEIDAAGDRGRPRSGCSICGSGREGSGTSARSISKRRVASASVIGEGKLKLHDSGDHDRVSSSEEGLAALGIRVTERSPEAGRSPPSTAVIAPTPALHKPELSQVVGGDAALLRCIERSSNGGSPR